MTVIRRLASARWKDYKRLRLESLKKSPLAFGSSFEEEARLGEPEWKKRMRSLYFALDGKEVVGMIACAFSKEAKFRHVAEIYSFYVRSSCRGRGIGTLLLDHAIGLAKNNAETAKVRLYVNSQQRTAFGMYRRAGFAVVGRLDREMKVGSRLYTMVVMEKRVR